ncbi:hypothetical protein EZS27_019438 [termite gut metagenome]|uniref:Uncharacterized protein n=1 Tax=termite gut metagenome TaxID=433724 RepID=A0A5J4RD61_9ZZZZ
MPVSLYGSKEIRCEISRNQTHGIETVFGRTGFSGNRSLVIQISYGTVYAWVKEWGAKVDLPKKEEGVEFMELDEMHTYVGSKKTTVGSGLPLIDSEKDLPLLSVGIVPHKQDSSFGKK